MNMNMNMNMNMSISRTTPKNGQLITNVQKILELKEFLIDISLNF